jgi:hypothetical protein
MIGHQDRPDQFARNYGFHVEISGGDAATSTNGAWKTFRGGGLRIHESQGCTRGEDKFKNHTRGICEWDDIQLTGALTADRKNMLQWYLDMVNTGDEGACYRDVSLIYLGPNGTETHRVNWLECFLTAYSLTPLDGDEEDVECVETIEICVGYSDNYLT